MYIDGISDKYEAQYEIEDNTIVVEIFNYIDTWLDSAKTDSKVTYKGIKLLDFSNKKYIYSQLFYNCGSSFGLVYQKTYRTDFFFESNDHKAIELFSENMKFNEIKAYNAVLCFCFKNSALETSFTEDGTNYKIRREPEAKIIPIGINNINKIEINTSASWLQKNDGYSVQIDTRNYAKLYLFEVVDYKDLLAYINELDVMIGSYMLVKEHSYETYVRECSGFEFKLIHKLISENKTIKAPIYRPIKIEFSKYLEDAYRIINYRNANNRNEFVLLDFKKLTFLEDEYIFYFRFIDLYYGKQLKTENKNNGNYARLSAFIDKFINYFEKEKEYKNIDSLKNELNSLRNHFVHEGYYFQDERFAVTGRKQEVLYYKNIDYSWLFSIVKTLKYCCFLILYEEIMKIDIDEVELKYSLK